MWKLLSEKEKVNFCVKKVKATTLKKLITKQLLNSVLFFIFALFVGFLLLFPGPHSRISTIPTLEEIIIRSIFCLGISTIISIFLLLYSFISYYSVPQDIKVKKYYIKSFSSSDKLCLKCDKSYAKKFVICPDCNNQLVDRKDYIWNGKIT